MSNKGFIATGNSRVVAQQVVVGDNAQIVNYDSGKRVELVEKIDSLIAALSKANLSINDRNELLSTANTAKAEATKEKPDKNKFESSLSIIEKTASSISGVAAAIKVVKDVAGLFFGV